MTRVAIYGRVSTRDKGQEVENQLRQLRAFAQAHDWTISREYVDRKSGATNGRHEFQAMFKDARTGSFDVVLFWALDRFTREGALPALKYLEELDNRSITWKSFTEPYLDSTGMFHDAVVAIIATIAKQERQRISERVKAGLEVARTKGHFPGCPKGRLHKDRKVIDVASIRRRRAAGETLTHIAADLGVSHTTVSKRIHGR